MLKKSLGALASIGCLSILGCLGDTGGSVSQSPEPSVSNTPETEVLVSARLNDTAVSSTLPANLKVEFFDGQEPRVTFELSIDDSPTIAVVAVADYAFLETGAVEVDVTDTLETFGANVFLAGASQHSGRLKLELGSKGKLSGTLLDATDRMTLEATVSFSCAVAPSYLPSAPSAPVPTNPEAGEVLVVDSNFGSTECQAARDFLRL